jgi:hypothetical protein
MHLVCTNEDCESNTEGQQAAFNVNLTVGEDGEVTESIMRIPGEYL